MRFLLALLTFVMYAPDLVRAQASDEIAPVYYVVREQPTFFLDSDARTTGGKLQLRESVQVLEFGAPLARIKREDGTVGYVHPTSLSNVWVRVSKSRQAMWVYRGIDLVKRYPADMGANIQADKERRGSIHNPDTWITPEGTFYVSAKNPRSNFYKAFVLNYPTPEVAANGLRRGLISEREYFQIVDAAANFRSPPMNTALGGWIVIHGHGTGGQVNWTRGCVALRDVHMDELWDVIEVGTPVIIER